MQDFNYEVLKPMDVVLTNSKSFTGGLIRFVSSGWKFKALFNRNIANHVGIIVKHSDRLWIAEMLKTGLEINSLRDYLKPKKRICMIRRCGALSLSTVAEKANELIIQWAHDTKEYDMDGVKSFVGVGKESPNSMYCSELVEIIANKFHCTWDKWNLKTKKRISPFEVQNGNGGYEIYNWLKKE